MAISVSYYEIHISLYQEIRAPPLEFKFKIRVYCMYISDISKDYTGRI